MCLIIYNRGGESKTSDAYLESAYENNPDGFGLMWADNGKVHVTRGLFEFNDIRSMIRAMDGLPHVVHFRYRTRGPVDVNNCHPHRILSTKSDGVDLWMMHNGTFFHLKADEDESDTVKFAKAMRGALRVYGPDSLFDKNQLHRLANRIGSINKIVFLRGDGKIALVNKNEGYEEDGCWYSNTYSLKPGYRAEKAAEKQAVAKKLIVNEFTNVNTQVLKEGRSEKSVPSNPIEFNYDLLTPRNQKKDKKNKKKKSSENQTSLNLVKVNSYTTVDGKKRSIIVPKT